MKKLIVSIVLLAVLSSGCKMIEHKVRVDMYNAAGESTGHFTGTSNRPVLVTAKDENGKELTFDTRGVSFWSKLGENIMNFAMLGMMVNK